MNTASKQRVSALVTGIAVALLGSSFAAAQTTPSSDEPSKQTRQEPSKQTRDQLAQIHDEMATCLRSDKSMSECQTQMHDRCVAVMGDKGCPPKGGGKHHKRRDSGPSDRSDSGPSDGP